MGIGIFGTVPINVDPNQLGVSQSPRLAIQQPSPYFDGLVEDIILNERHPDYANDGSNLGDVRIRILPTDRGLPVEQLGWACPLESSVQEYPLKNETVLVYRSLGRLFYSRKINTTKKVGEATWPALGTVLGEGPSVDKKTESAILATKGIDTYNVGTEITNRTIDQAPRQNPNAKHVRPCEGDLILQGRFGNIIRMGSNWFSSPFENVPQPNILMTVGQHAPKQVSTNTTTPYSLMYENINEDKSSIWMVSDQLVKFVPATAKVSSHLISSKNDNVTYTGAQIFINSDRVILNSKLNEISLFSNTEINLSSVKSITLDSNDSVSMTAENDITVDASGDIFIRGNTISLKATKDLSYKTSGNYSIVGKKIFIGSNGDTTQPMVLGTKLAVFLQQLVTALATNLPGFSNVATAPAASAILTPILNDLQSSLSNPLAAPFNSKDNFTSEINTV